MKDFILNPNKEYVDIIINGILKRNGHCPCRVTQDQTTLCPCDDFVKNEVCKCNLFVKIDDNLCVETLFKNEKEMAKNVHNLRALSSYIEDGERLILVFNKVDYVCLRKKHITGDVNKLKNHLSKVMAKNQAKNK